MLGAHIHRSDFRAPQSVNSPKLNLTLFITPSVSPIYDNFPEYTILTLSDNLNKTDV
jgi:hypothetical protein